MIFSFCTNYPPISTTSNKRSNRTSNGGIDKIKKLRKIFYIRMQKFDAIGEELLSE